MKSSFVGSLGLFACVACHGANPSGAVVDPMTKIDAVVQRLNQASDLRDRALGAHRTMAHGTIKMAGSTSKARAETLDERYVLDVGAAGEFHLVHDVNEQDGMEAIYIPPTLYIRPRYGKFVRRQPEEGELRSLRALVESNLSDYIALAHEALVEVRTEADSAQGSKTELKLLAGSAARTAESKNTDWRKTIALQKLNATLAWRGAPPVPAGGNVKLAYRFERASDGKFDVEVEYEERLEPAQPIAPPEESVTLSRPRPMVDRDTLLTPLRK